MNQNPWVLASSQNKPEPYEEVLVWVDGHRPSGWRNNYALVAYLNDAGEWRQFWHPSVEPLVGVICWCHISVPES